MIHLIDASLQGATSLVLASLLDLRKYTFDHDDYLGSCNIFYHFWTIKRDTILCTTPQK